MTEPAPIVTPGHTITPAPSQTSSSIVTGRASSRPLRRSATWQRVRGGKDLDVRSDEHAIADAHGGAVEDDAIEVDVDIVAQPEVRPVVAMEWRLDPHARAAAREQCRQRRDARRFVVRCGVVERMRQFPRSKTIADELRIGSIVGQAAQHPLAFGGHRRAGSMGSESMRYSGHRRAVFGTPGLQNLHSRAQRVPTPPPL